MHDIGFHYEKIWVTLDDFQSRPEGIENIIMCFLILIRKKTRDLVNLQKFKKIWSEDMWQLSAVTAETKQAFQYTMKSHDR